MSEEEFWFLSPREFAALLNAESDRQRQADLRAGVVASAVLNAAPFGKKGRKAFVPSDFFASLGGIAGRGGRPADSELQPAGQKVGNAAVITVLKTWTKEWNRRFEENEAAEA